MFILLHTIISCLKLYCKMLFVSTATWVKIKLILILILTIVLSMWFTILSNSFTVWDISFILQKLLHSSMIPFPLNSGVSSLNLHEYYYISTASIFFSRHIIPCSIIICYHTSIGIRSDHMSYSTSSYSQLLSDLLYGYRIYFSFSFSRVQ